MSTDRDAKKCIVKVQMCVQFKKSAFVLS